MSERCLAFIAMLLISVSAGAAEVTPIGVRSLLFSATTNSSSAEATGPVSTPEQMNRWNLGLRASLELAALGAMGTWGYDQGTGFNRYLLMAGVPVLAAATWGVFAVEGDPSRSGHTIVPTPGALRLGLELAFFGFSVWALHDLGHTRGAWGMGASSAVHYVLSYERLAWLLSR